MPVPTEKEKKGSFFYFASIFLREKTVVRPSLHVCGLFRQDLGAGRRRGEEQQICLSLTPSPQPPSVSELGKRGRDSTTNVFWQMPRPRKPQICWRNPSPPSHIAWRPEKLRGKFSLSLSFEQNKPCDLPLFSLSLVPSKRRLWVVPLSKRRRRRRRTDGVKTLISIKKAKIRSFQERYLSLKRRIPPTEIHTELLCKNFLLLCRHKAKAPISCLEKNQRRFGKTAVVASFFVSASKERTTPFFQKKRRMTHTVASQKKKEPTTGCRCRRKFARAKNYGKTRSVGVCRKLP